MAKIEENIIHGSIKISAETTSTSEENADSNCWETSEWEH